jgi:ATP-dependent RNA helicase SUPV3L1/SUV3
MAEKLLREAHDARASAGRAPFLLDPARAVSTGLTTVSYARLLRLAGFQPVMPRALAQSAHGPPAPVRWRWRPPHRQNQDIVPVTVREGSAFAALADLVR